MVSAELQEQNSKHDVQLFKVKKKTIDNAILAYKEDHTATLSCLDLLAIRIVPFASHILIPGETVQRIWAPTKEPLIW